MSPRLRRDEYTVGWICALSVELAAAQEMLDEEHEGLERSENDENLYSLGSIAGHNVVIACLPAGRIGINPAATVATQMKTTFKGIRFGLMVGIGGGVPSAKADIRLGDVVVSQPDRTFGGVVQYDAGKTTPSGFERTGSLNAPPSILLAAVAKVQANELRGRSKLSEYVSKIGRIPKFQRKRAGLDVLFEAAYDHEGGHTCDKCSTERQEARLPRDSEDEVVVHYGTIASGNQVMRNGRTRDRLSSELGGILCFEMEAAGLMDGFPCLVIRGICDYADSHKTKTWQGYASAAAAAYAKELLCTIPNGVEDTCGTYSRNPGLFLVPYQQNPNFFGRHNVQNEMERFFADARSRNQNPKLALVGMGGVGKTQTAVEYCYAQYNLSQNHVFWVNARDKSKVENDMKAISIALSINKPGELASLSVKNWLNANKNWLIVFDNVIDAAFFSHCSPGLPNGDIIFTTRDRGLVGSELVTRGIFLDPMDEHEAASLVALSLKSWSHEEENLIRRGMENLYTQVSVNSVSRSVVTALEEVFGISCYTRLLELVSLTGCLPLAVVHCASYMREYGISFAKYRKKFTSMEVAQRRRQFSRLPKGTSYTDSLMTAWEVSYEELETTHSKAAKILSFLGFLDRDNISERLFEEIYAPPTFWNGRISFDLPPEIKRCLDFLNADEDDYDECLGRLASLSLIQRNQKSGHIRIHSIVHEWIHLRMEEKQCAEWLEISLSVLYHCLPPLLYSRNDDDIRPRLDRVLCHASRAMELVTLYKRHLADIRAECVGFFLESYLWYEGIRMLECADILSHLVIPTQRLRVYNMVTNTTICQLMEEFQCDWKTRFNHGEYRNRIRFMNSLARSHFLPTEAQSASGEACDRKFAREVLSRNEPFLILRFNSISSSALPGSSIEDRFSIVEATIARRILDYLESEIEVTIGRLWDGGWDPEFNALFSEAIKGFRSSEVRMKTLGNTAMWHYLGRNCPTLLWTELPDSGVENTANITVHGITGAVIASCQAQMALEQRHNQLRPTRQSHIGSSMAALVYEQRQGQETEKLFDIQCPRALDSLRRFQQQVSMAQKAGVHFSELDMFFEHISRLDRIMKVRSNELDRQNQTRSSRKELEEVEATVTKGCTSHPERFVRLLVTHCSNTLDGFSTYGDAKALTLYSKLKTLGHLPATLFLAKEMFQVFYAEFGCTFEKTDEWGLRYYDELKKQSPSKVIIEHMQNLEAAISRKSNTSGFTVAWAIRLCTLLDENQSVLPFDLFKDIFFAQLPQSGRATVGMHDCAVLYGRALDGEGKQDDTLLELAKDMLEVCSGRGSEQEYYWATFIRYLTAEVTADIGNYNVFWSLYQQCFFRELRWRFSDNFRSFLEVSATASLKDSNSRYFTL